MANIKIAQLTNATTISDTDIVLIEDSTQTKKMTVANLKSLLGINSGGIVDSGSNANGSYVKFGDGTVMAWHTLTHPADGGGNVLWTFPVNIISALVDAAAYYYTTTGVHIVKGEESATNVSLFLADNSGAPLSANQKISCKLIGRWKA